jgi:signal transduction histidine kinase
LKHFQLDALVSEALELIAAECAARGIISSFVNEAGQACRILGDADRIRQVLLNLMINSLDAMPHGGSLSIRIYAPEHQPHVCFEVKDTGVGIPEELLPTIHLPFVSSKKQGLGLGLAKVYAIIEEHDGAISCASTLGQGTTFTVCLKT